MALRRLRKNLGRSIQDLIDRLFGRNRESDDNSGANPSPTPDNHVVRQIVLWYGGVNMSSATLDPSYQLQVSADGRNWSEAPASWRSGHGGPGGGHDAVGTCCVAYQNARGDWVGGKYEWLTRPVRPRHYGNIRNGYNGWVAPSSGTPIKVWVHTGDGNRVSNVVDLVWP